MVICKRWQLHWVNLSCSKLHRYSYFSKASLQENIVQSVKLWRHLQCSVYSALWFGSFIFCQRSISYFVHLLWVWSRKIKNIQMQKNLRIHTDWIHAGRLASFLNSTIFTNDDESIFEFHSSCPAHTSINKVQSVIRFPWAPYILIRPKSLKKSSPLITS